jgi:hypothetical protein
MLQHGNRTCCNLLNCRSLQFGSRGWYPTRSKSAAFGAFCHSKQLRCRFGVAGSKRFPDIVSRWFPRRFRKLSKQDVQGQQGSQARTLAILDLYNYIMFERKISKWGLSGQFPSRTSFLGKAFGHCQESQGCKARFPFQGSQVSVQAQGCQRPKRGSVRFSTCQNNSCALQ